LTEIPEHLLKRSKAARGKPAGDSGSESSEAAAAESTNAPVAASGAPASSGPGGLTATDATVTFPNLDSEPEPPKPEPAYVTASKRRNRVPVWALPVVVALPVWALSFAGTMQQPEVEDPVFVDSAALYTEAGCAGCHGGTGGGGVGYQLSDGEVLTTFPKVVDQMVHVARGSAEIGGEAYGADGRRVAGDSGSQMPAQVGTLTRHELELVVFHERAVLSGEDVDQPGYQEWMEHMREHTAESDAIVDAEYIDFMLACATPGVTPGATGEGSPDPEAEPCPGPHAEGEE
jgi:mono/diheme cytochrome c family protein